MQLFAALNQRDGDSTELIEYHAGLPSVLAVIPTEFIICGDGDIYDALKRGEVVELEIRMVK
jgi:hypothetical protein